MRLDVVPREEIGPYRELPSGEHVRASALMRCCLPTGEAVSDVELQAVADAHGVAVRPSDVVAVRRARNRHRGPGPARPRALSSA
jgi:hypothetical protein